MEKSVIDLGQPEHSKVTTCAYCGVGCSFKAEMRGDRVVRMVPYKDGKANHGHSCVKGRFAWGYASHPDRILKPMVRAKITGPQRGVATFADHMALGVMSQLAGGDPDVDPGDVRRLRDLVSRIAEGRYADYARRCASGHEDADAALLIDSQGAFECLHWKGLPLFKTAIPYCEITEVEVDRTTWLDGWGIHMSLRGGWVWNIWGWECVKITRSNRVIRIGTNDPVRLAEFLQTRCPKLTNSQSA